jgi:hypothetical protein
MKRFSKVQTSIFAASVVIILITGWVFITSAKPKKQVPKSTATGNSEEIPLLEVREDTLTSLFKYFFHIRNIENSSTINPKGIIYRVHIGNYGNNAVEILNNPKLRSVKQPGITISVSPSGEIDGEFARFEKDTSLYVKIPTDIFFRLLVNKNTKKNYVRHK